MGIGLCVVVFLVISLATGYEYRMTGRGLTSVPGDVPLNATSVSLSDNAITLVDDFPALTDVWKLELNSNLQTTFPNLTSINESLTDLSLTSNKIGAISPNLLAVLTKLTRLLLMDNLLYEFPDVCGPCSSMSTLRLSQNQFTSMPILSNVGRALRLLVFDQNSVSEHDMTSEISSDKFEEFSLSFTKITRVPILKSEVKAGITILNLANCKIRVIEKGNLAGFCSLIKLRINSNSLSVFPDLRNAANSLMTLEFGKNKVPLQAHAWSFRQLSKLTSVDLSHTTWVQAPNFCHVDFQSAPTISMDSSDWNCDCHAKWLKMLEASGATIETGDYVCSRPESIAGTPWTNISLSKLTCEGNVVLLF